MKILVTGGGGFLGGAIVDQLLARGDEVVSVSRGAYPALRDKGVATFQGDLADEGVAEEAAAGCDVVIHTAAKAGYWGDVTEFERANVVATQRILDACAKHSIGTLVFTSSPSVSFHGTDQENAGPDEPYPAEYLAHYPRTKAKAEQLVLAANGPDLKTTALRPHLIWGPGDPHLIPRTLKQARAGKLKKVGSGLNKVDLTFIDNAAQAHICALDELLGEGKNAGKPYYVSNNEPILLWTFINDLLAAMDLPPVTKSVSHKAARRVGAALETAWNTLGLSGEPKVTRFVADQLATHHYYDPEPAREDFGYEPKVPMEEGFRRLVEWLHETKG